MADKCLDIIKLFLYTHDMVTEARSGEYSAIHQYDQMIKQLSWIESARKETPLETRLRKVLHHIVDEEHQHVKELEEFLTEDILNAAMAQFADCECNRKQLDDEALRYEMHESRGQLRKIGREIEDVLEEYHIPEKR